LGEEPHLISKISDKIREGNVPEISNYCDDEEERQALLRFLYKTKDYPHTHKLIGECLTLTYLTT
jgi:transcriptional regulator of NAD metabolism